MKSPWPITSAVLLALTVLRPSSLAAAQAQVGPPDALAVVVHRSNPVDNLSLMALRRIFTFDTQSWPNGRKITVVLREKGQPERSEAIRLICRMSEQEFDRHILFQTFRGSVNWGPRSIQSSMGMLRFVFNAPGAIGYVHADETDDMEKVLRIDGLLPSDARYPLRIARP